MKKRQGFLAKCGFLLILLLLSISYVSAFLDDNNKNSILLIERTNNFTSNSSFDYDNYTLFCRQTQPIFATANRGLLLPASGLN